MYPFRLTHLLALYLFFAQTFAALKLTHFSDNSYGWQYSGIAGNMTHAQVKAAAQAGYDTMVNEARQNNLKVPSVMASLFIPTHKGGLLVLASSIKGAKQGTSVATENFCSDQQ